MLRIENRRDDREMRGVDLERAFRQSLSRSGLADEVGLRDRWDDLNQVIRRLLDLTPSRDQAVEAGLSEPVIRPHSPAWSR
jgi:hypothetical protein